MRSSKSRSRNKSNRQRSLGNIINRVFDSSGPEGKVRGTPQQIIEKYLALARDAQLGNDRVAEQAFLQHAEHYSRMLGEAQREMAREQEARQPGHGGQGGGNGNGGAPRDEGRDEGRDEMRGDRNEQRGDRQDGRREERQDGRRDDRREERRDERRARDYGRAAAPENGDEQPDFAPLGAMALDHEPAALVETPEMYHAPQPAAFEGQVPDFLAQPVVSEDRPRRSGRAPKGEAAKGEGARADGTARPPRTPRGPRRPKSEAGADARPAGAEGGADET